MAKITIQYRNVSTAKAVPISGDQVFEESMVKSIAKIDLLGAGAVKIEEAEDWLLLFPDGSTLRLKKYVLLLAEDPSNALVVEGFEVVPGEVFVVAVESELLEEPDREIEQAETRSESTSQFSNYDFNVPTVAPAFVDVAITEAQPQVIPPGPDNPPAIPPVVDSGPGFTQDELITLVDEPFVLSGDGLSVGVFTNSEGAFFLAARDAGKNGNDRHQTGEKLVAAQLFKLAADVPAESLTQSEFLAKPEVGTGGIDANDFLPGGSLKPETAWLMKDGDFGNLYLGRNTGNVVYVLDADFKNDIAYKQLALDEALLDVFQYTTATVDGDQSTGTGEIAVRVTGVNDQANAVGDRSADRGVDGIATEAGLDPVTFTSTVADDIALGSSIGIDSIFNNDTDPDRTPNTSKPNVTEVASRFEFRVFAKSIGDAFDAKEVNGKLELEFNYDSELKAGERGFVKTFDDLRGLNGPDNTLYTIRGVRGIFVINLATGAYNYEPQGPQAGAGFLEQFVIEVVDTSSLAASGGVRVRQYFGAGGPNKRGDSIENYLDLAENVGAFRVAELHSGSDEGGLINPITALPATLSATGDFGRLEMQSKTGAYAYSLDAAESNELAAATVLNDVFTYALADGDLLDLHSRTTFIEREANGSPKLFGGQWKLVSAAQAQIAIEVHGRNDHPEFATTAGAYDLTLDEHSAGPVSIALATDADRFTNDLAGNKVLNPDELRYDIVRDVAVSPDEAKFDIDAMTGEITFRRPPLENPTLSQPNFESPDDANGDGTYLLQIQVKDFRGGIHVGGVDLQSVRITLNDKNDAPRFSDVAGAFDLLNGENLLGPIGIPVATDEDLLPTADSLRYEILGGKDRANFTIDSATGELSFVNAPNFEVPSDRRADGTLEGDGTYEVLVGVKDFQGNIAQGGSAMQLVKITPSDQNDAPTFNPTKTYQYTLGENLVGPVVIDLATDEDLLPLPDRLEYAIAGGKDQAKFSVDPATGALTFLAAPDFELPSDLNTDGTLDGDGRYEVELEVRDFQGLVAQGGADRQVVVVEIFNRNDSPVIGTNALLTTTEDSAAAITAAFLNEGDVDDAGAGLTYKLTTLPAQGFVRKNGILLGANGTFTQQDIDQGRVTFDPGLDFQDLANDANGITSRTVAFDFSLADGGEDGSAPVAGTFSVKVTGENDAPTLVGNAAIIPVLENSTAVTTIVGADPDMGANLTYTIVGGADQTRFTLNPTTGALIFTVAPDFETKLDVGTDNRYVVDVQVSDGVLTAVQTITARVDDITNVRITSDGGGATVTKDFLENGLDPVTTVVAVEDEAGATPVTYSIAAHNPGAGIFSPDGGDFAIDVDGKLRFIGIPNFELPTDSDGNGIYRVTVRASIGGSVDFQRFDITLLDGGDAPRIISNNGGAADAVNLAEGSSLAATVVALDTDLPVVPLIYSIAGGSDSGKFTIDATTGLLSFMAPADFEVPADANFDNAYEVTVRASDGTLSDTQALTINITDQNEAPVLTIAPGAASIFSNAADTQVLADANGADPDLGGGNDATSDLEDLIYSIQGVNPGDLFEINSTNGEISLGAGRTFVAGVAADYSLTIRVTDRNGIVSGLSDDETVNIHVEPDALPLPAPLLAAGIDLSDLIGKVGGTETADATALLRSGAGASLLPPADEVLAGHLSDSLTELDLDAMIAAATAVPSAGTGAAHEIAASETPAAEAQAPTAGFIASTEASTEMPAGPSSIPNFDDLPADAPAAA